MAERAMPARRRKRDETGPELIDGSCRAHLSPYKIPEVTHFVPEIPRTGSERSCASSWSDVEPELADGAGAQGSEGFGIVISL